MGKTPHAIERPLPPAPKLTRALRGGLGPNKASGHKGGISRQGSKRGYRSALCTQYRSDDLALLDRRFPAPARKMPLDME